MRSDEPFDGLTDEQAVEGAAVGVGEAVLAIAARTFEISAHAAVLGVARALGSLALFRIRQDPGARPGLVALIRRVADAVECESSVKH